MTRGRKPKYPNELPEWFILLANDARLGTADIAKLFSFCSHGQVSLLVKRGAFPAPDLQADNKGKGRPKLQWSKHAIMTEIERRKGLHG